MECLINWSDLQKRGVTDGLLLIPPAHGGSLGLLRNRLLLKQHGRMETRIIVDYVSG